MTPRRRPSSYAERVEEAGVVLRACGAVPDVAVVLGSGLNAFAAHVRDPVVLPYRTLPHWPVPSAIGHEGRLVLGTVAGRRVAALAGRVHLYEGFDMSAVTFAVRVLGWIGVRILILTNAAGGIDTTLRPGTLMLIDDHINLLGDNPLRGPNDERVGPRFPDMTEVYSRRLRQLTGAVGQRLDQRLAHGIYAAVLGPSYETPAEIRYLRAIGADAVGMSTVPEALVARHMGIEVLGLSCITNMAAGVLPRPLHHDEILETATRAQGRFTALLEGFIASL